MNVGYVPDSFGQSGNMPQIYKEFGIDDSSSYCQIVTDKGYLPIKAGDVIWKKSEVGRDDDGLVDNKTADYVVKGVADEGLTADLFLLQKTVLLETMKIV